MNLETFRSVLKGLTPENAQHAEKMAREIAQNVREDASRGFLLGCLAGYFMGYQAGTDGRPCIEDLHNPGLTVGGLYAFYDMGYTKATREQMPEQESAAKQQPADGRTMPEF